MIQYKKREELSENIKFYTKRTKMFSIIRLILACLIVFFTVCFLALENHYLYLGILLANIIIFTIVILISNPSYHRLKIYENLNSIYKKHDNRRNNLTYSFSEDGRQYIDYNDYKVLDLDILGPKSLYQYLCTAKTNLGKELLAKQLTNPDVKSKEYRECVKKLSESEDSFLIEASLQAFSNDIVSTNYNELYSLMNTKIKFPKLTLILSLVCYVLFIVSFFILLINNINPLYSLFFLIINYIINNKGSDNDVFNIKSIKYCMLLRGYENISKDVLSSKINDPYLDELKVVIKEKLPYIRLLRKTFDMLSYRQNVILNIIGNMLFSLNLIVIKRYNKAVDEMKSIDDLIAAISEIEVMLSLAVIGMDNEIYCLPVEGDNLYFENAYHPLVKNCVKNSFALGGGVIITGGNMSGKTTFQRMIGINQTLYNAGGLVCALYYESKYLDIVSSLRANDMLQEGISTFYAEINRMKKIISTSVNNENTLVLIDEIFKGTNAKDRIYSSLEIIKQLNDNKCLFIITTHDFELCDAKNILNYHFTERYDDNNIIFDYIIKDGKCNTTNARYLLKMAGIIKEN